MHATLPFLVHSDFPSIRRGRLETLQVTLGYRCNQSCLHCHVNAGPTRKEMMDADTVDEVMRYLAASDIRTLDLTGGAPELNPGFRRLVQAARSLGIRVIDRCNLTVLQEPGQEDTAGFLAAEKVEIVASLPCYLEENVDTQRGEGVYKTSLEALRLLNRLGYGQRDSGLLLNLVYNPQGPVLPPPQPADPGQRADQSFWQHAGFPGRVCRLHAVAARRASRREPRRRHVPHVAQHRLERLRL